jgi:hypothetical protein
MTSFTIQSTVSELLAHQTTKLQEAEQELSRYNASIEEYKAKEASLEAELRTQVETFLNVFGSTLILSIQTKLTDLYMSELTGFERLLFPYIGKAKSAITPSQFYWVLDAYGSYTLGYVQSLGVGNLLTLTKSNLVDATKELTLACKFVGMECYIPQLEVVIEYKNDYEAMKETLNKKQELKERICSLNSIINVLDNLPITQTVTYQVTHDGSCSIK